MAGKKLVAGGRFENWPGKKPSNRPLGLDDL